MLAFEKLKALLEQYEVDLTMEQSPTHTIKLTNNDIMDLVINLNKDLKWTTI